MAISALASLSSPRAHTLSLQATTETGLNSVLLNELTFWQQVLLFLLMILGSTPTISIITILIRRHFFKRKLDHLIAHSGKR